MPFYFVVRVSKETDIFETLDFTLGQIRETRVM